ncbi:hypothetical protein [Micromonospora marina]|uniref:hypothetical protein n=1 Tax=Micromonospora marina TaxID=307120 RepID=UPI003453B07F
MAATVFPAAAPEPDRDGDQHPSWCICEPCTTDLLARISRPLTPGGVKVDRALLARNSSPAGYASTERRTHRWQPAGVEQGGTALGDAVPPTSGGAR